MPFCSLGSPANCKNYMCSFMMNKHAVRQLKKSQKKRLLELNIFRTKSWTVSLVYTACNLSVYNKDCRLQTGFKDGLGYKIETQTVDSV